MGLSQGVSVSLSHLKTGDMHFNLLPIHEFYTFGAWPHSDFCCFIDSEDLIAKQGGTRFLVAPVRLSAHLHDLC